MTVLQNARPGASPVGDPAITCEPCTDAATWARLADAVPWATPQHAFAYGRTLETCFGYLRARHLVFRRAGVAVAGLPLIRLSAGWPFRAIYSSVFDSYGGPVRVGSYDASSHEKAPVYLGWTELRFVDLLQGHN